MEPISLLLTAIVSGAAAALQAWREHPEHRAAQALGRERFFASYRIQVCTVDRDYGFAAG